MTKLKVFRIEFDKPGATYAPGDVVTGKVLLNLSKPKNVKEIRLEAKGEAETHWTKNRKHKNSKGKSSSTTDHYRGHEHYFSVSNRLVGGSSDHTTLPAGQHNYNFSFQLPVNIPCSFEHNYGYVRYTVKVVLDRPWKYDHKKYAAFTVVAPYDLNAQDNLTTGIQDTLSRKFIHYCFFDAGKIKIDIKTRVCGFVPGETIDMIISHDNKSTSVDLTKLKLKLIKNLTFFASTPAPDEKSKTEEIKRTKVRGPFNKTGETSLKILVPSTPPSTLEHCSLINVSYRLDLTLALSGLHTNMFREYPIQIGTIPIYYQTPNVQNPIAPTVPSAPPIGEIGANYQQMPQSPQQIGFVVTSAPPYASVGHPMPDMPPPSYEECVSGSNFIAEYDEQGMHGPNVQFTPKYPVYKFPMPMPTPYPP